MAISDYAILAFNDKGNACNGIFKHPKSNAYLELYKTWLYVHDHDMWRESCGFTGDTIGQVNEGDLNLCGFDIKSIRNAEDNCIFVFVQLAYLDKDKATKKDPDGKYTKKYFCGVATYGYKNSCKEFLASIGREAEYNDPDCSWHEEVMSCRYYVKMDKHFKEIDRVLYWDESKDGEYDYTKDWVGVTPETRDALFAFVEKQIGEFNKDGQIWFEKVKKASALHFNQGDAFFANHFGEKTPAVKVGEKPPKPVISEMIKKLV
jgi:hypothetical protein